MKDLKQIKLPREIEESNPLKSKTYNYEALKEATNVLYADKPEKPDTLLKMYSGKKNSLGQNIMTEYFTVGDISAIVGRSGNGKSNLIGLIVSEMLNNTNTENFQSQLKKDSPIILVDTEQSEYDVWRITQKVMTISGLSEEAVSNRLVVKRTEPLTAAFRKKLVLDLIRLEKPQLLILDGVADIVTSINDEQEAKEVVAEIRSAAQEHGVHIVGMIHSSDKNTQSSEAMGWIGTVWKHKSEGQMNVVRTKEQFNVSFHKGRHGVPQDWAFRWVLEKGCPGFVEEEDREKTDQEKYNEVLTQLETDTDFATEFFKDAFKEVDVNENGGATKVTLGDGIQMIMKRRSGAEKLFGRNKCKADIIDLGIKRSVLENFGNAGKSDIRMRHKEAGIQQGTSPDIGLPWEA